MNSPSSAPEHVPVSPASPEAAVEAAEELRAATSALVHEAGERALTKGRHLVETAATAQDEIRSVAGESLDDAREKAEEIRLQTESLVRRHPLKALLAATGIGILIGRILGRRR